MELFKTVSVYFIAIHLILQSLRFRCNFINPGENFQDEI